MQGIVSRERAHMPPIGSKAGAGLIRDRGLVTGGEACLPAIG
jgi:hypothetical protein